MAWVWYCDSCDEVGRRVKSREAAVRGAKRHERRQAEVPDECYLVVSPPSMYGEVTFAAMIGAGRV